MSMKACYGELMGGNGELEISSQTVSAWTPQQHDRATSLYIETQTLARITLSSDVVPATLSRAPVDRITDVVVPKKKNTLDLPETTRARLEQAGIDLTNGYPYRPAAPLYLQDAFKIRNEPWFHDDAGARAAKVNPSKHSLLSAASKVTNLTSHIGPQIEGLQLKDLTDQQRDELALLIAERSVVFFQEQDLSPQEQRKLGRPPSKPIKAVH
ncbi:hypothetical protein LTR53_004185 [Teratosphaeriaceae sp. CCFEE 6253]|nr:hypothetical protein LTR53_004185 [Teratosphaeriaceae sp. CCFEE 6253]